MPENRPRRRRAFLGWEAVRANFAPALLLQTAMLLLVGGYFLSPALADVLHGLAEFKRAYRFEFVVVASVLAGSLLPELLLVLYFQKGRIRRENLSNLLFTAPLWGLDGLTVDLLYRGLAALLGDQPTFWTVAAKICIDQFGYNVLFAAPYGVIAYEWKNSGFTTAAITRAFSFGYYRQKIVPTLFTTWGVWIPLMAMIYSLPLALQFPLFSLALTFWVLLLTYMTNRFAGKSGNAAEVAEPNLAPTAAR